ncbi:glycosyltransferase [Microbacterium sp. cx-55]|uniref:glycosyltransferase family 2 protein n=1 Tax=Microbacterium sp. cx-55 TaxID=2875948 RepID=UPI001CBC453C|nr:glycosyltransferase [Microbacterium sp. cx-55]MBZ4486838.1 glycosyltransferase [Microbacterium sp. cx-55]UGB35767.1 glycosyltransferase [Microbacterium sp. cx-55]
MRNILISVATYKRPDLLHDLLESLASDNQISRARVCVVDNDPAGSGEAACERDDLDIRYVVEPRQGIAAARNRGLKELLPTDEFVIFVDDDERVGEGWLASLLDCQEKFRADVVSGPVISVFPAGTPDWIIKGNFIQRARFATGAVMRSAATNNTLVSTATLRKLDPPEFDETFSMTGGSDTELFGRLRALGAQLIWCDEAVVFEDVPASRARLSWVWRRGIRVGNVNGRLSLRTSSRVRVAAEGVARIGYGVLRQAGLLIIGRGLEGRSFAQVTGGIGRIGACTNRLIVEYARKEGAASK